MPDHSAASANPSNCHAPTCPRDPVSLLHSACHTTALHFVAVAHSDNAEISWSGGIANHCFISVSSIGRH